MIKHKYRMYLTLVQSNTHTVQMLFTFKHTAKFYINPIISLSALAWFMVSKLGLCHSSWDISWARTHIRINRTHIFYKWTVFFARFIIIPPCLQHVYCGFQSVRVSLAPPYQCLQTNIIQLFWERPCKVHQLCSAGDQQTSKTELRCPSENLL